MSVELLKAAENRTTMTGKLGQSAVGFPLSCAMPGSPEIRKSSRICGFHGTALYAEVASGFHSCRKQRLRSVILNPDSFDLWLDPNAERSSGVGTVQAL